MSADQKSYLKSTLLIGICGFISNVLGLLRNTLFSAIYGATSGEGLADCYIAAFSIPNLIYNLVASGIISILLIPYFISIMQKKDIVELNRACSGFVNLFFIVISFFIILAAVFMPFLVRNFLLTGWDNKENIELVISMSRIILLQVLLFTLSSVFGSYLNALEKFAAYSLAMLFYNVGIILGITVLAGFLGIEGVAWGVVLGAFFHFGLQFAGSLKNGFRYSLNFPKFDRELLKLSLNTFPRVFTLSANQIIRFFFVNFASFMITGSMLILDNGENIALIPYTLIAISVSTTAFPIFIKFYQSNNYAELYKSLFEKLRFLLFFILPILCFMLVFRKEVISLLVGYGRYTSHDINLTAEALFYFILGTPGFAFILVIVKFYYAKGKTMLPMFLSIFSMVLTILLSYLFAQSLDVSGLALGRSLGNLFQAVLLLAFIFFREGERKKYLNSIKKPIFDSAKIIFLCIPFVFLAYFLEQYLNFSLNPKLNALIKLGSVFLSLAPLYFLFAYIIKIPEARLLLSRQKDKF